MAHERTREILWTAREVELLRAQEATREIENLDRRRRDLHAERMRCHERARHFEIAAVTLDMKGVP